MGRKQKVYLSLGSNLGNRHENLQKAIFRIQQKAGSILDISSVYENPAIGFEGDQFLNIVVSWRCQCHIDIPMGASVDAPHSTFCAK